MTRAPATPSLQRSREAQGIALLTLSRPERRNAVDRDLSERLLAAVEDLATDPSTRAIVLTGAPPGFCAGSDVKELAALDAGSMARHEAVAAAAARALREVEAPTVAAVEGFAIGGGFLLAAACDIVVGASDARWHLPEVALGWVPPWGLHALAARVGPAWAKRLAWSYGPIDSEQANGLGIVDVVVEPGRAVEEAMALAAGLVSLPASAVRSTKRVLAAVEPEGARASDELANRRFAADCLSSEARTTFETFSSRVAGGVE